MKSLSRIINVTDLTLIPLLFGILFGTSLHKGILIISIAFLMIWFIKLNIKPTSAKAVSLRLNIMYGGRELAIIFAISSVLNILIFIAWSMLQRLSAGQITAYWSAFLITGAVTIFVGIMRMFFTSKQLGMVQRILIFLFWWVPVVNIVIIVKICKTVRNEYWLEADKLELNATRAESEICKTRYPILMVHGVFFRDWKFFNYWGRIPAELKKNGAVIFYGNQRSAASVEQCAVELKSVIENIVKSTGCEKVNIIAHSKGGLDSRYAISCLGAEKYVASLTTVNTPHHGCKYADFILKKSSFGFKQFLAKRYNSALKKFGEDADFIAAVTDLTAESCSSLNRVAADSPNIYYQSIGSRMRNSRSAGFPLNISYHIVRLFDRNGNDGLVDIESMKWGSRHIFFEPKSKRGLSHGDMIDLMREDIKGFDIREEYVKLVSDLKNRGL